MKIFSIMKPTSSVKQQTWAKSSPGIDGFVDGRHVFTGVTNGVLAGGSAT